MYSSGQIEPTMQYQRYEVFNDKEFNTNCAQMEDRSYPKTLFEMDALCIEGQELFSLAINLTPTLPTQEVTAYYQETEPLPNL